jgi:glycerophosphoryl diester phosphodiesterase
MNVLRVCLVLFLAVWMDLNLCSGQMIVAHRGASHHAPENTLAAFKLAWQQGSDGIEGDFYLTADGKIVCIHDRDTERTGGQKLDVEQSTLNELRKLEYGGWKDTKYKGEPIPTFEQVLQTVPNGKTFVIELKSKQAIVPVLTAELKRLQTDSIKVLIISFDEQTVMACKKLMPATEVHWLTSFDNKKNSAVYEPTAPQIAATVRRLGADGVGMKADRAVVDAEFIKQLAEGGCPEFHLWTVDAIDDAKFFQRLGAVGITTNRPGEMVNAIRMTSALDR